MMTPEFAAWHEELLKVAAEYPNPEIYQYVKQSGEDAWLSYFEDGYSPRNALGEDLSYADD
jgi:hypothetical protein